MSLFPAYASENKEEKPEFGFQASSAVFPKDIAIVNQLTKLESDSSDDSDSDSDSQVGNDKIPQPKLPLLEFTGDEEYFVDKKGEPSYRRVSKLQRPACPRYRRINVSWKESQCRRSANKGKKLKRYFQEIKKLKNEEKPLEVLEENEFIREQGTINAAISRDSSIENWLQLLELQGKNPYKWSRLFLAEKKLEILQRAFLHHPQNDVLYRKFIDIINATYPPFEVSQMLDGMLFKDSLSYTLWTAQIMATQGSMARCIVRDVLKIYERCMNKMHHGRKFKSQDLNSTQSSCDDDTIMLKLFNNCAQFLRATGLYEQFFALIKLCLELNVSVDKFDSLVHDGSSENVKSLIEYEELILQSGLPMNEIWLRIERLRQGFNFLPQTDLKKCSDPQSIVFNEDVCHYVYPLKVRENSFQLMLIILRLCKVPLIFCEELARKFSEDLEVIGDSDAVEDVLGVCIRNNYILPMEQHEVFVGYLYDFVKEMVVTPTYLSNCIGHELYAQTVSQLILNCSETQELEKRRNIFLVIWCRFQRMLILLEKVNGKLSRELLKTGRNKFKNLLKQASNRNSLLLYIEFALFEYEMLESEGSLDTVKSIFRSIISNNDHPEAFLCYGHVIFAEVLVAKQKHEEAVELLVSYITRHETGAKKGSSNTAILAALNQIQGRLSDQLRDEYERTAMALEEYFLPDLTVCLLKLSTYLQHLIGQKAAALQSLERHLKFLGSSSERHRFLRERIYELYTTMSQLPDTCTPSQGLTSGYRVKLFSALDEFPRNMFLLEHCAMFSTAPWYQVRSAMFNKKRNILSLIYTVIAIRYRLSKHKSTEPSFEEEEEFTLRNRILNLLDSIFHGSYDSGRLEENNLLKRNALFWRFYLRCLSDKRTDFEVSKKCLLTALDECPWSKALYIDGATKVPQEFSHLQDLLIEKQLRIYALPEELEILREQRIS